MLRGIGMSILLSWVCLNSYAQLPNANDTLDNGKKVPFNQFLGRLSFYSEGFGAGLIYSLNVGYGIVNSELITLDYTIGGSRLPMASINPLMLEPEDYYKVSSGLRLHVGRRKSRLTVSSGYAASLQPGWFSGNTQYPRCGGICAGPPQHMFTFSLGYTYQHPYGVFFGLHAYGIVQLTPVGKRWLGAPYADIQPWPGITLGYRLPSRQLRREWTERSFKRRVLRLEEPKEKKKKGDEIDAIFYSDEPVEIDSAELQKIESKLARLKRQRERNIKEEQRLNGRSHVFVEGFGAAGFWSVNYSYTDPIGKSKTFAMDYRGGYGTDSEDMSLPLAIGVKAMKNYRGTGLFIGAMPRYNWTSGKVGFVYFLQHNVEFHFAYGLTGGVSFYYMYDPTRFLFDKREWAAYGGLFLGYRLPQMKK